MMDNEHKSAPADTAPQETAPEGSVSADEGGAGAAQAGGPSRKAGAGEDGRVAELEQRIATLEADAEILKDKWLRNVAELENLRRRTEHEKENATKFAVTGFAKALLDVADNLRRAIEAVPAEARAEGGAFATLADGVEATERQMLSAFERNGVVKLDPLDQAFDPNFHQAMFEVPGSGKPAGTIVQVLQPGYLLHERLLRPALVGVAAGEAESGAPQSGASRAGAAEGAS